MDENSRLGAWYTYDESRSFPELSPHFYATPVILGDLPGDRQPQSQALGRPGFLGAVEALEDVCDLVLGYPDSCVGNLYPYATVLFDNPHGHPPPFWGVLHGVVQEDRERLPDTLSVEDCTHPLYPMLGGRGLDKHLAVHGCARRLRGFFDYFGEVVVFQVQFHPFVAASELEQLLHQSLHALRLALYRCHALRSDLWVS